MILDSNIIIYSIKREYEPLASYLRTNVEILHVSAISMVEVLGFHRLNQQEKQDFEIFFRLITVLDMSAEIVLEAIRLRQQRKRSLGDSIIAATALLHNLPVLTNNTTDFADIAGLTVIPLASVL
jgi:toxin FitB